MILLLFRSIRTRLGNVVGAFTAMTIAIALIAGSTLLIFTAASASVPSIRFTGTSLIVQFDPHAQSTDNDDETLAETPRIDGGLAQTIAAVPGVAQAVPDLTFYAQIVDANGRPVSAPDDGDSFGAAWTGAALTPFNLTAGTAPAGPNEIVIDARLAKTAGLAAGDTVQVLSSEMPATYTIAGIAAPPTGDALKRQSLIFFTPEVASRLSGAGGKADLIGVIAQPGVDLTRLAKAISEKLNDPQLRVLKGNDMAKADSTTDLQALQDSTIILAVMSGFAGFVAIFVLAGTFAFSIQQRTREIGLLRSIGMTPGQVKRMIAIEAFMIAVASILAAIPLSFGLAETMARLLIHFDLAPAGFGPEFSPWPFAIAFGAGLGISQLASFGAGWRAGRIRPIEALREASANRRLLVWPRLALGLGALAGGIVLLGVSSGMSADSQVSMSLALAALFLTAAALLGPLVSLPFSRLVGGILARTMDASGDLARWNSRRSPNRVAAVTSPLILAIGFASLMFCLTATMQTATMQQSRDRTSADFVITTGSPGLPLGLIAQTQAVPGVAAASGVVETNVTARKKHHDAKTGNDTFDYTGYDVVGVDPSTIAATMNLDVLEGDLNGVTGSGVAVSKMDAESHGYRVGDAIDLVLADGSPMNAHVAAIYRNALGLSDLLLPFDVAAAHADQPLVQQIFVKLAPGANGASVRDAIQSGMRDLPAADVITRADYIAGVKQSNVDQGWSIYLIIGVSVLFAGIAVINTVAMSTSERVREFALLRLIGGTTKQIRAMVLGESLIVLTTGVTLGVGIGLACMIPVSRGLVGDGSAITAPPLQTAALLAVAALIAIGAHLVPARAALRANPMEHIGQRE